MSIKDDLKTCYIRVLNVSAEGEGALDIFVNKSNFADNIKFKEHTKYMEASEGTYDFEFIKNGVTVLEKKIEFEKDLKYTIVIMGEKEDYTLELIIDIKYTAPEDKALVRFINVNGVCCNVLINGKKRIFDLEHCETCDFFEIEQGEYTFEAIEANSGKTKCYSPRVNILNGKQYSIYLWPDIRV